MNGEKRHYFDFDEFRVEVEERRLTRNGRVVALNPRDFDILLALVERAGTTVDKNALLDLVWDDTFVEEGNLSRHVSTLRKILGDDSREQRFIKTIPKRGYRFTAAVREVEQTIDTFAMEDVSQARVVVREEVTESVSHAPFFKRPAPILAAAALAVVLTGGAWFMRTAAGKAEAGSRTVAVIPFRNLTANNETDFLSYALAQSITGRLGYVKGLVVRPTAAGERFRGHSDTKEIAAALNAGSLLMGSYAVEGDKVRVSVELVDAEHDQIMWQNAIDLAYVKLASVQDRVASDVVRELRLNLTDEETRTLRRYVPHPTAYEYDLRGIAISRTSDYLSAMKMYEKAVEADPNYALAWTHVAAVCYFFSNDKLTGAAYRAKAEHAIERALQLEPDQIEARLEKAFQMVDNEGRGEEAITILRDIIGTNDNIALAHWHLSQAYRYGGALDESIAEGRRALEIDPDVMWDTSFNSLLYAGQYEEFLSSLALKPDGARTSFYRGLARLYLKDEVQAVKEFDLAFQIDRTYPHAVIGQAMKAALSGSNAEGSSLLRDLERDRTFTDGEMLYKLAQAHSMLGNHQDALRLLRKSVDQNFFCYPYFESDALLNGVRQAPEFAAFLVAARERHERFRSTFF